MRIGTGYDVHKLVEGRDLIIGGVKIDHTLGLLGHSDADVLLHAIADAVLGAAGLKDIGAHFPDTDPKYKGADSMKLLEQVRELVMDNGYVVGNVDATVRPFIEQMEANVAKCLGIDVEQVNIKATTEEHLGFTGREEGISAQAVCLLYEFYDGSNVVFDSGRNCGGCSGCPKSQS